MSTADTGKNKAGMATEDLSVSSIAQNHTNLKRAELLIERKEWRRLYASCDWLGIIERARTKRASTLDGEVVLFTLRAALSLERPDLIAFATSLCFAREYDIEIRAKFAREFISGNLLNEAFAILIADSKIWEKLGDDQILSNVLGIIAKNLNSDIVAVKAATLLLGSFRRKARSASAGNNAVLSSRVTRGESRMPAQMLLAKASLSGSPTHLISQAAAPPDQERVFSGAIKGIEDAILSSALAEPVEWRDVFLNRWGDLWDSSGNIIRSISKTAEPPLLSGGNIQEVDTLINCCGMEFNKNLYHWFIDVFPSLGWRLDMTDEDIPVAIGDHARPWVRESLLLGANGHITILPVGDMIFVRRLISLKLNPYALARPEIYRASFGRIIDRIATDAAAFETQPIYISRRDSGRRRLDNEVELESALQSIGVKPVIFTGLSLREKILKIRRSPLIIGAHGAGLTMLAFAEAGRKVLEIMPAQLPLNRIHLCMAGISRMIGHEHYLYLENGIKDRSTSCWTTDVPDLISQIRSRFPL